MKKLLLKQACFALFVMLLGTRANAQKLTAADTARVREEVLETTYPSLEQIDSLLDFDPKQGDIWLQKALRLINDDAVENLETIIENAVKYTPKSDVSMVYMNISNAWTEHAPRNTPNAIKYADLTIKERPDYWASYFIKAYPYLLDSNFKAAEEPLRRCQELAQTDPTAESIKHSVTQMWGYCIHKNGRSDEGLKRFNSIKIDKENEGVEVYLLRSDILTDRKEYDAAIYDLTKALEMDIGNAQLLEHRFKIYEQTGKKDLAIIDGIAAAQVDGELESLTQKYVESAPEAELDLKEGSKLTYIINGDEYRFTVTIKKMTEKKVVFDYAFSNNPDHKGTITLEEPALVNAKQYIYYFSEEDKTLTFKGDDEKSAIFLSRNVFKNVEENKFATLIIDETTDDFKVDDAVKGSLVLVRGKWVTLKTHRMTGEAEGFQVECLKNKKYPLIVSTNQHFKIKLIQVD